jgi:hypothetical protein
LNSPDSLRAENILFFRLQCTVPKNEKNIWKGHPPHILSGIAPDTQLRTATHSPIPGPEQNGSTIKIGFYGNIFNLCAAEDKYAVNG